MALSGNQITSNRPGGAGRAYLGFLAKTESVVNVDYHGVNSPMTSRGTGVLSALNDVGKGVNSSIDSTQGLNSPITSRGTGVLSTITDVGLGVNSEID